METKPTINKDLCICCGACVASCPSVFEFDDDGSVRVIAEGPAEEVEAAASGCPVQAIEL